MRIGYVKGLNILKDEELYKNKCKELNVDRIFADKHNEKTALRDAKSDFDWYINLSGDGTTFTLDYLEQNRLSSYEKRAENTLKMRDEKYTLMFAMYLNYDDAKAYKVKFGKYLKEYQWEDLLVKVYIRCCK